jgi:hypothetical protein
MRCTLRESHLSGREADLPWAASGARGYRAAPGWDDGDPLQGQVFELPGGQRGPSAPGGQSPPEGVLGGGSRPLPGYPRVAAAVVESCPSRRAEGVVCERMRYQPVSGQAHPQQTLPWLPNRGGPRTGTTPTTLNLVSTFRGELHPEGGACAFIGVASQTPELPIVRPGFRWFLQIHPDTLDDGFLEDFPPAWIPDYFLFPNRSRAKAASSVSLAPAAPPASDCSRDRAAGVSIVSRTLMA